ncbi:MAG: type III pantothenate kinase [Candidatus Caenarcaniphilales bacterium]|nr:type III pantothenate kinase [Candidatus Caenarcaniphilales bacterium]
MKDKQILILGNTNLKLAIFSGEELKSIKKETSNAKNVQNLEFVGADNLVVSVKPDLHEFLPQNKILTFFDKDLALQTFRIRGLYEEFGVDRLANLIAAMSIYPNNSVGVLDFGTCTTLSILDWQNEEAVYKGGLIVPGMDCSFEYLSEKTASLNKITDKDILDLPLILDEIPRSAKESILTGAVQQILFLTDYAIKLLSETNYPCKLLFTGGWSYLVNEVLTKSQAYDKTLICYEPNLSLIGGNKYLDATS